LFSKLPHGDVLRKQAESDHQDISQLFAALGKNIKDADLLYEIANKLEQHIRFEERELFNHLQNILSQEELEDVAARPANNSNAPEEAWKDKFWIK
jgi:hemerythrin-like domain-containing protein